MYKPQDPDAYADVVHCLECGEPLYGRSDKKFCNSLCRNAWHGHIRSASRLSRHSTLAGISGNYAILENLLKINKTSCPMDSLISMGFHPELVTHAGEKRGRHTEYRCFDIAYFISAAKIFNLHRI